MGHGAVLFFLGLIWMCMGDRLKRDPDFVSQAAYNMRYFITMCGFFSVYVGLIYNEFFAINVPLFPSCYDIYEPGQTMPPPSNELRG